MEKKMGDNDIDIIEAKARLNGEKPGVLDRIDGRIISRKFFVFWNADCRNRDPRKYKVNFLKQHRNKNKSRIINS